MDASNVLNLTSALIECPSLTPHDAGCQTIITEHLIQLNFNIEQFHDNDVLNLWAKRGTNAPLFVFIGHTDVVPTGPLEQWTSHPFTPTIRDGYLYGRGSADMKSGIAAMLTALNRFIKKNPEHLGSIGILITSDEEGHAINGTQKIIERLLNENEKIDWCLVGEPTSDNQVGDVIKNGRRGSLSFKLNIQGKQGHIAYPHLADNPIHRSAPAINELISVQWDEGNQYFQPTGFQISNIHAGTGANNVIPGNLEITGNFRFSPAITVESLQERLINLLNKHQLEFNIQWHVGAMPFFTKEDFFVNQCRGAIKDITGIETQLSTTGGTSDGRFVAPTGAQVLELGVCNATIHQIDECVKVSDLQNLSLIYERLLERLLLKP